MIVKLQSSSSEAPEVFSSKRTNPTKITSRESSKRNDLEKKCETRTGLSLEEREAIKKEPRPLIPTDLNASEIEKQIRT